MKKNFFRKAMALVCVLCMVVPCIAVPASAAFTFDPITNVATIDSHDKPNIRLSVSGITYLTDGKFEAELVMSNPTAVNIGVTGFTVKAKSSSAETVITPTVKSQSGSLVDMLSTIVTVNGSAGATQTFFISGEAPADTLGEFAVSYQEMGNTDSSKVYTQTAFTVFANEYTNPEPLADGTDYTEYLDEQAGYSSKKYLIGNTDEASSSGFAYVSVYPAAYFTTPDTTLTQINPQIHFYVKYLSYADANSERAAAVYANALPFDGVIDNVTSSYSSDKYDFILWYSKDGNYENNGRTWTKETNTGYKTYTYSSDSTLTTGAETKVVFKAEGVLGKSDGSTPNSVYKDNGAGADSKNNNTSVPYTIGCGKGNPFYVFNSTFVTETIYPVDSSVYPTMKFYAYDTAALKQAIEQANALPYYSDSNSNEMSYWTQLETRLISAASALTTENFSPAGYVSTSRATTFEKYQQCIDNSAVAITTTVNNIKKYDSAEQYAYNAALRYVVNKLGTDSAVNIANWYSSGADNLIDLLKKDISTYTLKTQSDLDALAASIIAEVDNIIANNSLVLKPADYTLLDSTISSAEAYMATQEYADKYSAQAKAEYEAELAQLKAISRDLTIDSQASITESIDAFNAAVENLAKSELRNSFAVTFVDSDGNQLSTATAYYGDDANGLIPIIAGYTFKSWNVTSDEASSVKQNGIVGTFEKQKFTVTFYEDDRTTVISTVTVGYGEAATVPEAPIKAGYYFAGWSVAVTSLNNVTSDMDVYATYTQKSVLTVTFMTDGKIYDKQVVEYGKDAVKPTDPTKVGYTFDGWDIAFTNVTTDLTVTAKFKVNTYIVTFVNDTGVFLGNDTVDYGGTAKAPATPVKEGYTFSGWDRSLENITSNVTIKAVFTINQYTVTFDAQGGNVSPDSVTQNYGTYVNLPVAVKAGYVFEGWSVVPGGAVIDSCQIGEGSFTLYAVYSDKTYTVTFKDYDGTVIGTAQTVVHGGSATAPVATPTRVGYTFKEWDTSFDNVTSDLTVTAVYSPIDYTITFDANGGDGSVASVTAHYGDSVSLPKTGVSKSGKTFIGWSTDSNASSGSWSFIMPAEDTTLYAVYSALAYTVTFVGENGEVIDEQMVTHGQSAAEPAQSKIPSVEGKEFEKWDTDFSRITSDLTVKAVYKTKEYTVTFNDYDGSVIGTTQTVKHGEAAVAPQEPTRVGYSFTGWDKSFDNITGDTVVTAQYKALEYTVTLNGNGGTRVDLTVDITIVGKMDEEISLPTAVYKKTGCTFLGFNTDKNATTALSNKYVIKGNVTLYAIYKKNTYTLNLTAPGITGIQTSISGLYGEKVNLPIDVKKDGYTFLGWNYDQDAQQGVFEINMPENGGMIYAIFKPISYKLGGLVDSTAVSRFNVTFKDATENVEMDQAIKFTVTINYSLYKTKNAEPQIVQIYTENGAQQRVKLEKDSDGYYNSTVKCDSKIIFENFQVNWGDVVGDDEAVTMSDLMAVWKYANDDPEIEFTKQQKAFSHPTGGEEWINEYINAEDDGTKPTTLLDVLWLLVYAKNETVGG